MDVAVAALLIGVSGFLFGSGPESMHGDSAALLGYATAMIACVAAPATGFILTRRGKPLPGIIAVWMPPAGALAAMPPPPY